MEGRNILKTHPKIVIALYIAKKDGSDFDQSAVTERLCMEPDVSHKTHMTANGYRKPAFWRLTFSYENCLSVDDALLATENAIRSRAEIIEEICQSFDLTVGLTVNIYASHDDLPELFLSAERIHFWSRLSADIGLDFWWDEQE